MSASSPNAVRAAANELSVRRWLLHSSVTTSSNTRSVSVNPADVKMRAGFSGDEPKVLGFDASGTVIATGSSVDHFAVGDDVFYAGTFARPGSNADRHVVDSRIVGHKPEDLDFAESAAMPLTTITASIWRRSAVFATFPGNWPYGTENSAARNRCSMQWAGPSR